MTPPRTLLLADDHPLVLHGLRDLIAETPDLEVVASCSNGSDALELLRSRKPDLAVLDVSMPGLSGIQVMAAARRERLGAKIVLLTASISDSDLHEAVTCGVAGIILKECAPEDLIDCIRTVLAGRRWLPADLVNTATRREAEHRGQSERVAAALTARERDVCTRVARGYSNKVIARDLGVSEGTIKSHLHHVYDKLALQNRTELAALLTKLDAASVRA